MTRSPLLAPALVLASALLPGAARAGGADALPKRSDAGVRVRVAPAPGDGGGTTVSVIDARGLEHALRLEPKDGKVVVQGAPDPERPWLGVLLSDAEEVERAGSGLPTKERRWTITAVADDSPASRAGLRRGDVITGVGGRDAVTDGPGLLAGVKPGDSVTFEIERDGKPRELAVRIEGHPGTVEFEDVDGIGTMDLAGNLLGSLHGLEALRTLEGLRTLPCPPGTPPGDCPGFALAMPFVGGPKLGVSVEPMSDQLARYFGAEPGHGLLVKDVVAGSPAEKGGLQAGDVIVAVDGDEIHAVGDIRAALEDREEGDRVKVDVLRRGARLALDVTLAEVPQRGALDKRLRSETQAQVERALAEARESMARDAAARELEIRRGLEEARKALEEAASSGAFDADARRELEEALAGRGLQVVPADLQEF